MTREYAKAEREALIAETLAAGPMTSMGIARQIYGITTSEKIPRSLTSRITQSLRVMEREGIVKSGLGARGRRDWRLARLAAKERAMDSKERNVRETARELGVHENTVRNWAKAGRLRPYQHDPLRFTIEEVDRVRRNRAGRDLADVLLGGATVGILVVLKLPDMMTPEDAVAEVRRGIEFGEPRVGLHFVVPDAPITESTA